MGTHQGESLEQLLHMSSRPVANLRDSRYSRRRSMKLIDETAMVREYQRQRVSFGSQLSLYCTVEYERPPLADSTNRFTYSYCFCSGYTTTAHLLACLMWSTASKSLNLRMPEHSPSLDSSNLRLAVGHTVKGSFDQGCKAVRATPNLKDEEKKWPRAVIEKPSSKARRSSKDRGVHRSKSIYLGGAKGSEQSVRNMMQEDPSPSPPQFCLGREVDMYIVLKL
jgi:hypothetical protein